jgi:hypothetical protein
MTLRRTPKRTKPSYSIDEYEAAARKLGDNLVHLWNMPLLRRDAECDRLLNRMPNCADIDELSADLDILHLRIKTMLAAAESGDVSATSGQPSLAPSPTVGTSQQPRGRRTFLRL